MRPYWRMGCKTYSAKGPQTHEKHAPPMAGSRVFGDEPTASDPHSTHALRRLTAPGRGRNDDPVPNPQRPQPSCGSCLGCIRSWTRAGSVRAQFPWFLPFGEKRWALLCEGSQVWKRRGLGAGVGRGVYVCCVCGGGVSWKAANHNVTLNAKMLAGAGDRSAFQAERYRYSFDEHPRPVMGSLPPRLPACRVTLPCKGVAFAAVGQEGPPTSKVSLPDLTPRHIPRPMSGSLRLEVKMQSLLPAVSPAHPLFRPPPARLDDAVICPSSFAWATSPAFFCYLPPLPARRHATPPFFWVLAHPSLALHLPCLEFKEER